MDKLKIKMKKNIYFIKLFKTIAKLILLKYSGRKIYIYLYML